MDEKIMNLFIKYTIGIFLFFLISQRGSAQAILHEKENVDIRLLRVINQHRNEKSTVFFVAVTDSAALVSFTIPIILFLYSLWKKNKGLRKDSLVMAIALLSSTLILNILKYTVQRPRPFETYPFIQKLTDGGGFSFPSGHTIDAFTIAGVSALLYTRWYILIPLYLWAFLVGYSRMYLGVHYPSDVLAAALIASLCALVCCKVLSRKLPPQNRI